MSAWQALQRSSTTGPHWETRGRMADARQAIADHVALAGTIEELLPTVDEIVPTLIDCYGNGGRVYTFGNGGSAADSLHFAEELVARFARERRPLAAQSFAADPTVLTCIAHDLRVYARLGHAGGGGGGRGGG